MHQLPNQSWGEMDSETFLLMGFMVLPMLFIMFGLMQRMQGRLRELPAPPVSHAAGKVCCALFSLSRTGRGWWQCPADLVVPGLPMLFCVQGKPARDGDRDQGPPTPPVD